MESQKIHQTVGEQKIHSHEKKKKSDETTSSEQVLARAQWIRAAILGANDGLLSTTSLMLGVGAAKQDQRSVVLSGLAGAVAGACSMAVGEFVSVSTQRDIEKKLIHVTELREAKFQEHSRSNNTTPGRSPVLRVIPGLDNNDDEIGNDRIVLPNPNKAAAASALAFLSGSLVPLIPAALVPGNNAARIAVVVAAATVALTVFGATGARLGGLPPKVSAARVVVGGWLAMALTYALLKPFHKDHDHN